MVEECENECTNTGAAIFCDGQFLATAGNLQACADQLAATFDIHLDVTVSAHAKCVGNTCSADASAKGNGIASCALSTDLGARQRGLGAPDFLLASGVAHR